MGSLAVNKNIKKIKFFGLPSQLFLALPELRETDFSIKSRLSNSFDDYIIFFINSVGF